MREALAAFFITFVASAAIARLWPTGLDVSESGPQKFHTAPVPRIGGVAMIAGLAGACFYLYRWDSISLPLILVMAAVPAFLGGLAEDLTRRVSPGRRLWICFVAPAIAFFLLDARVTDLDIPGSTALLGLPLFSFFFTVFAVGGFAHALNIVDGFNGLSAMVVIVTLTALEIVALQVGDLEITLTAVIVSAVVFGFFVWNYPSGLLFAGDGGAYLLGFLTAELAVLLVERNSEVSPWFPLVVLLYPVVETLFSIYRKKILRGQSPGEPDGVHLHMLIYKRLVRRAAGSEPKWRANSRTSPYLGALAILAAVPAVLFWDDSRFLVPSSVLFTLVYVWLYWRIVRFRTPRMLTRRRSAPDRSRVELTAPRAIESTEEAEQLS